MKSKKILVSISLVLALGLSVFAIADTSTSLKLGDTNGDGSISAADALEILHYSVGKIDKFSAETSSSEEFDAYINGVGYSLGQELTFDIILTTNDTNINVCPCFTVYKKTNNNWEPYDITSCFENFWGEEPTIKSSHCGPVDMETDDNEYIIYGMWCWMGTGLGDSDENFNFSNGEVIQRFKLTVVEKGEFEFRIQDGIYEDQNNYKYNDSLSIKIY